MAERAAWRVMVAGKIDPKRLVFVDEMGTNTPLFFSFVRLVTARRASAMVGAAKPWAEHDTLLASITVEGVGPSMAVVEGATTKAVFEAYVEEILAPTLRPGQVVVMDNLSAHRGSCVRELVEGRGCELLYLPPYSPDLDPIEEAFAKIKDLIRKAEARTRKALVGAMGQAIWVVSARDARGFFEHCGYCAVVQSFW
jgi:transposase